MPQFKILVFLSFVGCLVRVTRCATTIQGSMNVPTSQDVASAVDNAGNAVGQAASGVGNAAGKAVSGAGNLAGQAVSGAGNLAGKAVSGVGNAAGKAVSGAGNLAGQAVSGAGNLADAAVSGAGNLAHKAASGAGNLAGAAVSGAGNLASSAVNGVANAASDVGDFAGDVLSGAGNALTYAVTAAGRTVTAAGRAITNVGMFPINAARDAYGALQMRMTKLQLQMAAYKQALAAAYNVSSVPYMYQSALFDNVAIVDLQPYVDKVNGKMMGYGQVVRITRTNGPQSFVFPTLYDASGTAHAFPNGFSIQQGSIVNARGVIVGLTPQYKTSYGGQVLTGPAGNQYTLGADIFLDLQGNLRYRVNNQPWAVAGEYVIDIGGNVYDSGGNIVGHLCRCFGITGSFGPNGSIVLT